MNLLRSLHHLALLALAAVALLLTILAFSPTTVTATPTPGHAACHALLLTLGPTKLSSAHHHLTSYDASRKYWNTRLDAQRPSCVVYPTTAADVSIALQLIRLNGSRFAIKAGGHNPNSGFSSVNRGVLIDLKRMTGKRYDPESGLASYEPGSRYRELYTYYAQHRVTIVGARLADVGTGLALGGGLSYLSGEYGLAVDSFRSLTVVLPSGEIVTASPSNHSDLFFALKGGGGNAYGVVTEYTVQARPVTQVWGGLLVVPSLLGLQDQAVTQALLTFSRTNTDPKAAIIGTRLRTNLPALLGLDEAFLLFMCYNGPSPGNAFDAFKGLPLALDTRQVRPYTSMTDLIPNTEALSRGNEAFRVSVHTLDGGGYERAVKAFEAWTLQYKLYLKVASIDYQLIPRSLVEASRSQGGNALAMPDGPWIILCWSVDTIDGLDARMYEEVQRSFKELVEGVGSDEGLPLFPNDAAKDQNPLASFASYETLKEIKAKYDPEGFFAKYTGGWEWI